MVFVEKNDWLDVWKYFFLFLIYRDELFVVFLNSKCLKKIGMEYGFFFYDSDLFFFKLKMYICFVYDMYFSLKDFGVGIVEWLGMEKLLNLYFDIFEFCKYLEILFYKMVVEQGKKIVFLIELFFQSWEGDIFLQEGGMYLVCEEVLEMEYDEEFNEKMVCSFCMVFVFGYGVFMSVNDKNCFFINVLFVKGIMICQNNCFYFLLLLLLQLNIQKIYMQVYFVDFVLKIGFVGGCNGVWNYKGIKIVFYIDFFKQCEVFGLVEFFVSCIIWCGKFFQ